MDPSVGVFADKEFSSEELALREAPLVGAQHSRNKVRILLVEVPSISIVKTEHKHWH